MVIRPIIKTSGLFADGGLAEIWLSDDNRRIMLQMKVKLGSFASISLVMRKAEKVQAVKPMPGATDTTKPPAATVVQRSSEHR